MTRVKKAKRRSKRGKIRKAKVSARNSHRKTAHHQSKTNKTGYRKRRGTRKIKVRNQKGGSDFLVHLLSGLAAGATAGLEAHAKENRKKWLAKNKKQS